MKIRSQKDIETLESRIKEDLGLDITKYKNTEVVDSFVEILIFPKYVISWVIRPVLIFFIGFIAGFIVIPLSGFEYVLYTVLGFLLFVICGILTGLLFLIWKMKSDMWGIIEYALDIMKSSVIDLNSVNSKLWSEDRKEAMSLLFQGIIHLVVVSTLTEVVAKKIPIIGSMITRLIKKILTILANKIDFEPEKEKLLETPNSEETDEQKQNRIIETYSKVIDTASSGLNQVLTITFKITSLPLRVSTIFAYSLLLLLLYLVWR